MKSQGAFYRFLNGKGFYVALGVCMVAIGISAWVATGALSKTATAKKQQKRQYQRDNFSCFCTSFHGVFQQFLQIL